MTVRDASLRFLKSAALRAVLPAFVLFGVIGVAFAERPGVGGRRDIDVMTVNLGFQPPDDAQPRRSRLQLQIPERRCHCLWPDRRFEFSGTRRRVGAARERAIAGCHCTTGSHPHPTAKPG